MTERVSKPYSSTSAFPSDPARGRKPTPGASLSNPAAMAPDHLRRGGRGRLPKLPGPLGPPDRPESPPRRHPVTEDRASPRGNEGGGRRAAGEGPGRPAQRAYPRLPGRGHPPSPGAPQPPHGHSLGEGFSQVDHDRRLLAAAPQALVERHRGETVQTSGSPPGRELASARGRGGVLAWLRTRAGQGEA